MGSELAHCMPADITHQIQEILDDPDITLEAARARYPSVFAWFRQHIDLADLIEESGVALRPISPDAPGVLVGECPGCCGPLFVDGGRQ